MSLHELAGSDAAIRCGDAPAQIGLHYAGLRRLAMWLAGPEIADNKEGCYFQNAGA
jgi:hypothetical protein